MATSWTNADITRLERAMADGLGAKTITFENQTVTFHTMEEQLELLRVMRSEVAGATEGGGSTSRTRFAATSKGF